MTGSALHQVSVLLSVAFTAVAVGALISVPHARLGRLRAQRLGALGRWWTFNRVRRLMAPRADAWPRRQRWLTAGLIAALIVVFATLSPFGGGQPVWAVAAGVGLASAVTLGKLEPPEVKRRRLQMIIDLPNVLELIASCLRAGLPLRTAVRRVVEVIDGPLKIDLEAVLRQVELGTPEPAAWRSIRVHPVLGRLAVDLARSVESGTMLVETLHQHAEESRRQRRGALEARAKTVGVSSVPPLMVCFLPAFLLIGVVPTGVTAFLHALG